MTASVAITVGIGPPLGAALDDAAGLSDALAADVGGVMAEVGLPGHAETTLTAVEGARPVQLTVHGRRERFEPDVLRRAWSAAVTDGPPAGPADVEGYPVAWLDRLALEHPDLVAGAAPRLVRAAVSDVLRSRPGVLVGADQAAAYSDGRVDPAAVKVVLQRLLDHGVAVRARELVLETLSVGIAAGRAIDDVAEGVVRRLQSGVLEIHVDPAFAPELLGLPLDGALSAFDADLPDDVHQVFFEAQAYAERRGIPAPEFVWVAGQADVPFGHVRLKVNDSLGPPRRVPPADGALVDESLIRLARYGIHDGEPVSLYGRPVTIVGSGDVELLSDIGMTMWSGVQPVGLRLAEEFACRGDRLFTVAEAEHQLAQLARYYPELVEDAIAAFSLPQLTRMLRALMADGTPIGDLRTVLQRLMLFEPAPVPVPVDWTVLDDLLAGDEDDGDGGSLARRLAYARLGLGELMLQEIKGPGRPLVVLPVAEPDECLENEVAADRLLDTAWAALGDERLRHAIPVIVTNARTRARLCQALRPELPHVPVLASDEIPRRERLVVLGEPGGEMTALEELTRSRVQEILESDFGAVVADADACWVLVDGAAVRVTLLPTEQYIFIRVAALAVRGAPRSPELYRWIAEGPERGVFGHVRVADSETEDHVDLLVFHELLGNYLDQAELVVSVLGVVSVASATADEVVARFGGSAAAGQAAAQA